MVQGQLPTRHRFAFGGSHDLFSDGVEFGLSADENEGGRRETACPKSSEDRGSSDKEQKADLTPSGGSEPRATLGACW
jgi:hypothetical protein